MSFWDDLVDFFEDLFGDDDPEPKPQPAGTRVNVRVRRSGGGNVGIGGALVTIAIRGVKKTRGTDAEGWVHFENVDAGPRHLYVEKKGYRDYDQHFEVKGNDTTLTVAIAKSSSPGPSPNPQPNPNPDYPPMTSDKVTALRRVAQKYLSEYSQAHVGYQSGVAQPKQEAFARRAAACLHYGSDVLGIRADAGVMLNGKRGGNIISQDALWHPDGVYDFLVGAGTQGTDINRLSWNRVDSASGGKAIQPSKGLVPKGSGGRTPPQGAVKAQNHAFADRRGAFIPVGSTFFSAVWAYRHNRQALQANAKWFADRGGDYFRILVEVGGHYWSDRQMNPHAAGAESDLAGTIDLLYEHGLRTQVTIFGGTDFSRTAAQRAAVVDQVARVANGREEKIPYVEMGNESWQTFDDGEFPGELRELAARFHSREPNILLAITAPFTAAQASNIYQGSVATVFTTHIERSSGPGIDVEDVAGIRGIPALRSSGEPRGPGASAGGDVTDPGKLINDFKKTINAGIGAYCYHSEAGVWMGNKNAPDKPNLWSHSTADAIVKGIVAARNAMPGDQANR